MDNQTQILTWKRIWLILIFIAAIWILVSARAALIPLAASFILAYLLQPLVDALERWKIPRPLAVLFPLLGLGVGLFILWVSISPVVQEQVRAFAKKLPDYINLTQSWLIATLDKIRPSPDGRTQEILHRKPLLAGSVSRYRVQVSAENDQRAFLHRHRHDLSHPHPRHDLLRPEGLEGAMDGVFRLRAPRLPRRGGETGLPARRTARLVHQGTVADRLHPLRLVRAGLLHRGDAAVAGDGHLHGHRLHVPLCGMDHRPADRPAALRPRAPGLAPPAGDAGRVRSHLAR